MRRTLLITVAALSFLPANAADTLASVSAGEHDGYSRIVVTSDNADLSVETAGRTIRIRNIGDNETFDLRDINEGRKAFRVERARKIDGGGIDVRCCGRGGVQTVATLDGEDEQYA